MAGIESLRKRILKDDENKAREVIEEAEAKAQEIQKQSKEKAELLVKEAQAKAERDGNDRSDRIIARAHLDARNNVLAAKQETIDRILDLAEEKINSMDNKEFSDFVEELLLNSAETGDEEVIFSEKDRQRVDPGLVARVNEKLVSMGRKGMLKLGYETRKMKSGFILRKGGIEINCSVDSQIRILRDSLEGEIANLLFENR